MRIGSMLAIQQADTDTSRELFGVLTSDPASGRPAVWVSGDESVLAESLGYLIQDPTTALLAHLEETVRRHAHEILSLDEVGLMLNKLRDTRPEAAACVPMKLDLAEYHQVLRLLLRERVSIRDQELILETLTHHLTPPREPGNLLYNVLLDTGQQFQGAQIERMRAAVSALTIDPALLAEVVRRRLSWHICENLADEDGMFEVIELRSQISDLILDNIKPDGRFRKLVLRPDTEDRLVKALVAECAGQDRPVVLCDSAARPYVRQLVERVLPHLVVISHDELHPSFHSTTVGTVSLIDA